MHQILLREEFERALGTGIYKVPGVLEGSQGNLLDSLEIEEKGGGGGLL